MDHAMIPQSEWEKLPLQKMRRALGFTPPTLEEADVEMAEAEEAPMSDEMIQQIVTAATKEA